MSKKWWTVVIIAVLVGVTALVAGFKLPKLGGFLENILAEVAGLTFALALAIWLIEGPILTRERRRRKVIAISARPVAQLNEEIALTLVREIGQYLAGLLDSNVNLYGDERGDWKSFKSLLRQVFKEAKRIPEKGLPKKDVPLTEGEYQDYVNRVTRFSEKVHNALGTEWEIQATLLGLVEHLNKLNTYITKAGYPPTIRDEKMRYSVLGAIGDAIIDLIEACPKLKG